MRWRASSAMLTCMSTARIAAITIPDSGLVRNVTAMIRDMTNQLIHDHSRRVFLFGSLQARALRVIPDPESGM